MIPKSTDGKTRVLSLSYGKDSMACLGALEILGWPLDRIITADVWATDTIPAELPPMVEFKSYADAEILRRYGIEVEHFDGGTNYERCFYKVFGPKSVKAGEIWGFPILGGNWCNSQLKVSALKKAQAQTVGSIAYIGIAADEPQRFHNLSDTKLSPLVEINWAEDDCRAWCEREGLLSPIYTKTARGGCWFCHQQGVEQLRLLRREYPDLWAMLLKWDADSPKTFKTDGHTVHDYDERFALEDEGLIDPSEPFFWKMLEEPLNYRIRF